MAKQAVYPALQANAGFPLTPSDSADVKDDAGNKEGVDFVYVHNRSVGGEVRVMPAGQTVPPTITLTGTSGTANISINGVNYLATFSASLTTTATNFVTSHAATLKALNIVVTSNGAELRFVGADPARLSIANATGDLSGTVLAPAPITIWINQGQTSEMAVRRVYATSPAPPASLTGYYSSGK